MKIQNESLFKHSLSNGINLFLGAGFSIGAQSQGKSLPVGDGLKTELLDHFKRPKPSTLNLAQLCQILSRTQRDALTEFFRTRFTVSSFDTEYKYLERARIEGIFTTNIDDLIPKIFAESNRYYINDVLLRGPVISGSNAIDYIPLHGCVNHGNDEFDFSPLEIASSFERDRDKWFGYVSRIQQTPTLYWGYRVEDAGVLQALAKETISGRKKAESWIVLRKDDKEAIEYYESLDFQTIIADTVDLLKYFGQLTVTKQSGHNKTLLGKYFAEYQIPKLATVPVRSINEFYLGSEPSWYDVYTGKVPETSHFNEAKNAIAGTKHVVLSGGAVTGKSTLLKQLATRLTGFGTNIFIDEITPEKAGLLVRDTDAEGQKVLAFVDNAADASEAIQVLVQSPNFKVVAAERDYVFDSVSHRFPKSQFTVLEISGLTPIDTQEVQNSIPKDIFRRPYQRTQDNLTSDIDPTFFEVITSTITQNSLVDRFMDAIKSLKGTNPPSHDLLIVSCYCYASRIPISVDIATAYCRQFGIGAIEVAQILESMGNFLSEYEGTLADGVQQHYVPRSRQVSETILNRIPISDLRHVLEIFHSEVSPTTIGRYDIFRRSGYDAKLIGRAFPNWEDGLEFYNQAFIRDPSHSLKQQGALYLAYKRNYELAFIWIDEAKGMASRNHPSVRNSYAVILFNANYEKQTSVEVMATLDESMEILEKCYYDDHKRAYHARVFSDHAIRYWKKFPNAPKLKEYLDLSEQWLSLELQQRTGDRRMTQMRHEVRKAKKALS